MFLWYFLCNTWFLLFGTVLFQLFQSNSLLFKHSLAINLIILLKWNGTTLKVVLNWFILMSLFNTEKAFCYCSILIRNISVWKKNRSIIQFNFHSKNTVLSTVNLLFFPNYLGNISRPVLDDLKKQPKI